MPFVTRLLNVGAGLLAWESLDKAVTRDNFEDRMACAVERAWARWLTVVACDSLIVGWMLPTHDTPALGALGTTRMGGCLSQEFAQPSLA